MINMSPDNLKSDLNELRKNLIPGIAHYNCLRDGEVPAEKVRLMKLSDVDFRDEALRYLRDSIAREEEYLGELREKWAALTEEPAPAPNPFPNEFRAVAPVLVSAIKSGSDQGKKVTSLLWSLYADDHKISLRESLSNLDDPTATAIATLIAHCAHRGAKAIPLVGFILRLSKAEAPSRY